MKNILIIGAGAAGLSAAVTAAQAGAKVTVLEKRSSAGGNGRYAEGVFAAGSKLQQRLNIDADPDKLFTQAMEYSHWRSDARLMRALIDRSGETVDWLTGLGVPFSRVLHHMPNQTPEVFHMAYPAPTGARVMEVLRKKCKSLGVKVITGAECQALIIEDGAVTGVAVDVDVLTHTLKADAVMIATGGFAGDRELMGKMIPGIDPQAYMHLKGIPMTGDGLRLARAVGCAVMQDIAIEGCAPVFKGRSEITAAIRREDVLWVNAKGRRFCDETVVQDFVFGQNAVARQPGRMCWAILDLAALWRAYEAPPHMMAPLDATDNGMAKLFEAVEKEINAGGIYKADTLEELAQLTGMPSDALVEEVAVYNAACAAGHDPLFAKDRRYLYPVAGGPYYAVRCGIDIITTHGGIAVDWKMRVLDEHGDPIPGLYAAGIDISGVDSGDYSVRLSGHAFGFSLAGGRIAGEQMAAS